MGEISYRNIDSKIEKEISRFCDKHIYCSDIVFNRNENKDLQLMGIDGTITIPKLNIQGAFVDEKASGHYVNNAISTYLMELSQIARNGEEVDGWFLSDNNKTEYYMLMYIWAQVPQYYEGNKFVVEWQKIREDNITLIEYYLVKKSDIFDYLNIYGFNKDRLRNAVVYLRNHSELNRLETKYGFKFVISRNFQESPVNLCINKSVYNKICKLHRFIGKYDFEKL